MAKQEVTGIILSGGKSSRLGEEKGLALFQNKPLITYAIDILTPVCDDIVISANNQLDDYAKFGFPVIEDEFQDVGPAGGLHACIRQSTSRYNFVLSCDTPFVDPELFQLLLSSIENFHIAAPVHSVDFIEPLCACYATNTVWNLQRCIEKGKYKLADIFDEIGFKPVKIHNSLPFFTEELFMNINTKEDLTTSKRNGNSL